MDTVGRLVTVDQGGAICTADSSQWLAFVVVTRMHRRACLSEFQSCVVATCDDNGDEIGSDSKQHARAIDSPFCPC